MPDDECKARPVNFTSFPAASGQTCPLMYVFDSTRCNAANRRRRLSVGFFHFITTTTRYLRYLNQCREPSMRLAHRQT